MKVINLGEKNSILNKFVAQMRDKGIQKDSMRFRRNLERLGEIFAYEISQHLDYTSKEYVTPLGIAKIPTYDKARGSRNSMLYACRHTRHCKDLRA